MDREAPQPPRRPRWTRLLGFAIALALLAAAINAVWSQRDALAESLRHAATTRWYLIALALALPALNWLTTSAIFYILTNAHPMRRKVRPGEMAALVGASWLFNYLPASPGLFGRVLYHQRFHGLHWKHSVTVVVGSMLTSVAALAVTFVAGVLFAFDSIPFLVAPTVLAVVALTLSILNRRRAVAGWREAAALVVRCLDLYIWAARYYVVLLILDLDPTPTLALSLAAVSQAALLIPFLGNGLGLREWAVGLVGPALPGWAATRTTALSVDLVNRACELLIAIPVGLISAAVLAANTRREYPEVNAQTAAANPLPGPSPQAVTSDRRFHS
ncbi:MAG TPA: hypothetical protein VD997_10050 [Phycisphaerales bacterium]|nr:hypothetical protein [Phycisphaerales bacterium]